MRGELTDLGAWLKAAWEGMRTGRPDLRPDHATPQIQETEGAINGRLRGGQKQVQRGMGNMELLLFAFAFFFYFFILFSFGSTENLNPEPSTWLAKYY